MLNQLYGSNGAPTVDLTQGLVAHYLLNNNADDSYGTYDGTPSGGVDFQGDLARFDGVDDKIPLPTTISPNTWAEFTYSLWVNIGTRTTTKFIFSGDRFANGDELSVVEYGFDTDKVGVTAGWYNRATGLNVTSTVTTHQNVQVNDGKNHHVILVGNATGILVYIDNILSTSYTYINPKANNVNQHALGFFSTLYYSGNISNTRIYNEAKDQTFIDALYAEGYYPKPLPLPTTDGLIAHFKLTGTGEDTTGNYDGIENGGLTYVDDAEFGSVANFDGIDDYVNASSPTAITTYTLTGWFNTPSLPTVTEGMGYYNEPDAVNRVSFHFPFVDGNCYFDWANINDGRIQFPFDASWYGKSVFVTWRITNTTIYVYINNVLKGSLVRTATSVPFTYGLIIGAIQDRTTLRYNYKGKIHNIRTYNRDLTTQEITDIYNYEKNFRPIDIDDGLVAYYPLANNSLDNYKNQYDGTDTAMTYDGLSAVFNGTNATIRALTMPSVSELTISLWINTFNNSASESILRDTVNSATKRINIHFPLSDNNCYFDIGNISLGGRISTPWDVAWANTWVHITMTAKSGEFKVYIGTTLLNTVVHTWVDLSGLIIDLMKSSTEYQQGKMAKLRFIAKAITAEQVEVIDNLEKGDFI